MSLHVNGNNNQINYDGLKAGIRADNIANPEDRSIFLKLAGEDEILDDTEINVLKNAAKNKKTAKSLIKQFKLGISFKEFQNFLAKLVGISSNFESSTDKAGNLSVTTKDNYGNITTINYEKQGTQLKETTTEETTSEGTVVKNKQGEIIGGTIISSDKNGTFERNYIDAKTYTETYKDGTFEGHTFTYSVERENDHINVKMIKHDYPTGNAETIDEEGFTHDEKGQLIKHNDDGSFLVKRYLDENGNISKEKTDRIQEFTCDKLGRYTTFKSDNGNITTYEYDNPEDENSAYTETKNGTKTHYTKDNNGIFQMDWHEYENGTYRLINSNKENTKTRETYYYSNEPGATKMADVMTNGSIHIYQNRNDLSWNEVFAFLGIEDNEDAQKALQKANPKAVRENGFTGNNDIFIPDKLATQLNIDISELRNTTLFEG